jgi:hypothetical protein
MAEWLVVAGIVAVAARIFKAFAERASFGERAEDAWSVAARRLGLVYTPGGLFESRRIDGWHKGVHVQVDTVHQGAGPTGAPSTRYVVAYPEPLGYGLRMGSAGLVATLGRLLGFNDIRTGDRDFDRQVKVTGTNRDQILALLTPSRRQRIAFTLEQMPELTIDDYRVEYLSSGEERRPGRLTFTAQQLVSLARLLSLDEELVPETEPAPRAAPVQPEPESPMPERSVAEAVAPAARHPEPSEPERTSPEIRVEGRTVGETPAAEPTATVIAEPEPVQPETPAAQPMASETAEAQPTATVIAEPEPVQPEAPAAEPVANVGSEMRPSRAERARREAAKPAADVPAAAEPEPPEPEARAVVTDMPDLSWAHSKATDAPDLSWAAPSSGTGAPDLSWAAPPPPAGAPDLDWAAPRETPTPDLDWTRKPDNEIEPDLSWTRPPELPYLARVPGAAPDERGSGTHARQAADDLALTAVCERLYGSIEATLRAPDVFDAEYEGQLVDWEGVLRRLVDSAYDFAFGIGHHGRAVFDIRDAESSLLGGGALRAVVQLPPEVVASLRGRIGERLRFEGRLVGLDVFGRKIYIADGRVPEADRVPAADRETNTA